FEPRVPRSTTVFKTAAIDHSATSPKCPLLFLYQGLHYQPTKTRIKVLVVKSGAKIQRDFKPPNDFIKKRISLFIFSPYL
ncbi:hypothetical protein AAH043_15625, partial [Bacteroides nordii]|uniref:hypothetical protein n=2 Tax=Bacteroides nordii TaxID=291645 RepID=UPI001E3F5999